MVDMLFVQPIIGLISDKIGHRPLIIYGSVGLFFLANAGLHANRRWQDRLDLFRFAEASGAAQLFHRHDGFTPPAVSHSHPLQRPGQNLQRLGMDRGADLCHCGLAGDSKQNLYMPPTTC